MPDSDGILLQRCAACARRWQTPLPGCPYCGAAETVEERCAGQGTVYAWVVVHRSLEDPPAPVPYTVVTVVLDAGAKVLGRYEGLAEPVAGQAVACVRSGDGVVTALTFFPRPR